MGELDELITLDEYDEDDVNVIVESINDDVVGNDVIKKALNENGFMTEELYETIMKEFKKEKSKNDDEVQKLKERIEEMQIESDIEKMEFEEHINNLEAKVKSCQCKEGVDKPEVKEKETTKPVEVNDEASAATKMSLDECFKIISIQEAVIKDRDQKIELFLRKIKDWGISEEKIYEEPKRKKSKPNESLKEGKSDLKVPASLEKKKNPPKPKVKEEPTVIAENDELQPSRRKSQRFIKEEPIESEETYENSVNEIDPYDFDWLDVPVRLYDVTSSAKLRKSGRRKVKRNEVTIPTFSTQDVGKRIIDKDKDNEGGDILDVTEEKYFYFSIQPRKVKISKSTSKKRKSVRFSLDPWILNQK